MSRSALPDPRERMRKLRADPNWRARVGAAAAKAAERAVASGDLETKLTETERMQPMRGGLPVQYRSSDGKTHLRGTNAPVVHTATAQEVENFTQVPSRTCGLCRYFELEKGREKIVRERFAERVVLENEWKLHHLGAPLDHMGVCGASNGTMATSTMADAGSCEGFRPRTGIFRR
jgi:hypothetical protein